MIQNFFALQCYTIEPPCKAFLTTSNNKSCLSICDSCFQIYQFDLSSCHQYTNLKLKSEVEWIGIVLGIRVIKDIQGSISFQSQNYVSGLQGKIGKINILESKGKTVLVVSMRKQSNQEQILAAYFDNQIKEEHLEIKFKKIELKEREDEAKQTVKEQFVVVDMLDSIWIIQNRSSGKKQLIKVNVEEEAIIYEKLDIEIQKNSFDVLFHNQDDIFINQKGKLLRINIKQKTVVQILTTFLPQINSISFINSCFVIFKKGIIYIYQIATNNMIYTISIEEKFHEVSQKNMERKCDFNKIIVIENAKKSGKLLVLEEELMIVFEVCLERILEEFQKNAMGKFEMDEEEEKSHQSMLKTAKFRIKMLQTLEKYITEGKESDNFTTAIRFLKNQNSLAVLNDGLRLFHKNLSMIESLKKIDKSIVKDVVEMCQKLVGSRYQGHIETGLLILIWMKKEMKVDNGILNEIVEGKRVGSLIKQEKKKILFELAYQLKILVKGFEE